MSESTLINGYPWDKELGPNFSTLFTNKLEAFYEPIRPENGGTCTLCTAICGETTCFLPRIKGLPQWLVDHRLPTHDSRPILPILPT